MLTFRLEQSSLSLVLEPFVHGVFVELPPSTNTAHVGNSDRFSVPPSDGSERHYFHLRPDDIINFQHQALKVAIMTEIPESNPERDLDRYQDQSITMNAQEEDEVHAEVLVKSSNVDPTEEDETDSSEDDLDKPISDHSARTPAVTDLTPATSRQIENTILETPHVRKDTENDHKDDEEAPFSTAQDALTSDGAIDEVPTEPLGAPESPTARKKLDLVAKSQAANGSPKLQTAAEPSSTINGTPRSESEDESVFKPRVKATYGKHRAKRELPRNTSKSTTLAKQIDGERDSASNGIIKEANGSPAAAPTSDITTSDAVFEAAKRTLPIKRKVSETEDDDSDSLASKKRKTMTARVLKVEDDAGDDVQSAPEEAVPSEEDNESPGRAVRAVEEAEVGDDRNLHRIENPGMLAQEDVRSDGEDEIVPGADGLPVIGSEDGHDQDTQPNEENDLASKGEVETRQHVILEASTPPTSARKTRSTRVFRRRSAQSEEEITVAQRTASSRKTGKLKSSPIVIVQQPQRASKRRTRASESPSSSVASSILTGKVPNILLSSESALHKSCGKWLKQQGVTLIDDVKTRRTNFVCVVKDDKLTTAKVLRSLALGKLVVTEDWITESEQAGHILEPDNFAHPSLKDSITDRSHMFKGKNLFFTNSLVKNVYKDAWSDIQALAKEAGASHADKGDSGTFGKWKGIAETICFGHNDKDADVPRLMKQHGCTVYHKDFLPHSIIAGELDLDNEEYQLSGSAQAKRR